MSSHVFRALGGALVCLALTVWVCRGEEKTAVTAHVPYGGQLTADRVRPAAEAAAWLAGLERAAAALAGFHAVRLAELDVLQLQALAAGLDLVDVEFRVDQGATDAEAEATVRLGDMDAGRVSRLLAAEDERERYADIIAALERLLPELVRPADASASGASADEPDVARLNRLLDEVEAHLLYRDGLDRSRRGSDNAGLSVRPTDAGETDASALARVDRAVLDKALTLAPEALPLRLAQAECLLREDRFRAAAQALENLPSAPDPAQATDAASAARDRADRRLLARALEARALAQLRSGRPALAESDLDTALTLSPERASLWLGRGAARQMRERFALMCDDYHQACVRGLCRGLAAARERGQCLDGDRER